MEKKVTPPLFSTQKRLESGEKWRKVEKSGEKSDTSVFSPLPWFFFVLTFQHQYYVLEL